MQIMNAADELLWFLGIKLFDILYISMRLIIYERTQDYSYNFLNEIKLCKINIF